MHDWIHRRQKYGECRIGRKIKKQQHHQQLSDKLRDSELKVLRVAAQKKAIMAVYMISV